MLAILDAPAWDPGDKHIHGIDLIQLDADGLIEEFTVMVRPLSAVVALGDAVLAGLAAGLVPSD